MTHGTERLVDRRSCLAGAALATAVMLPAPDAAHAQPYGGAVPMSDDLSADEVINLLKLEPNATCGLIGVTFVSRRPIAREGLRPPFAGGPAPAGDPRAIVVPRPDRVLRVSSDTPPKYPTARGDLK
jgi:hypothetical protein